MFAYKSFSSELLTNLIEICSTLNTEINCKLYTSIVSDLWFIRKKCLNFFFFLLKKMEI